jgi:hypothetical protein
MYLHKHVSINNISTEDFAFQRELAMEAYIIENPSVLAMKIDGFYDVQILECELPIIGGRVDKKTDGRIDILAKYGNEYLAVVELKLGELTEEHLEQLTSYLLERKQILEKCPDSWDMTVNNEPKWIGVMIGARINPELMLKIRAGHYIDNEKTIPIAALTINRFKGKDGNVYVVSDTYFVEKVNGRDYTKYLFKGRKFGKNRLVLAIIKDYVEQRPSLTYSALHAVFPDSLQGKETFTTIEIATSKKDIRNFMKAEELITLADATIAVSTEWGLSNIDRFLTHCKTMNIEIKVEK